MDRSKKVLSIRPNLQLPTSEQQADAEIFQNNTLRPILKLQHSILVARFDNDALTLKAKLQTLDDTKMVDYISVRLKQDKKLQREYIGLITALFTLAEYENYWPMRSEINRRLLGMLAKRLISHYKPETKLY